MTAIQTILVVVHVGFKPGHSFRISATIAAACGIPVAGGGARHTNSMSDSASIY